MSKGIHRAERLLREIPYVLSHPGTTLEDMAQEFSLDTKQAKKDVELISLCGLPGGLPGDLMEVDFLALDEGVVYLANVQLRRPLALTMAEAMSLHLALATLRAAVDDQTRIHVDSIRDKLGRELSPSFEITVAEGAPDIRQAIHRAIHQAERIVLTYEGQARGVTTYPVVDPGVVITQDGALFLRGYCVKTRSASDESTVEDHPRSGWRNYRMDRITDVKPTGETATSHGDPFLDDSWDHSVLKSAKASVWVGPDTLWLGEYHNAEIGETSGQETRIDIPVVTHQWFIRLLLSLGPVVKRVEPASYGQAAGEIAQKTLDAYDLLVNNL
jgi:proteasome accessory factor C